MYCVTLFKMSEHFITTSRVGHGNPAAAFALERLAEQDGIETEFALQTVVPFLANVLHSRRRRQPDLSAQYTVDSSSARESGYAMLFGWLSYHSSVSFHARNKPIEQARTLHIVQEHPLFGVDKEVLEEDGFHTVRLLVPDTYPKGSGVLALKKHPGSTAVVWNRSAEEKLGTLGVPTKLVKPFYLDAFAPDSERFKSNGRDLVVKSSGCGMPEAWKNQLLSELGQLSDGTSWSLHLPRRVVGDDGSKRILSIRDSIEAYLSDLGGKTRFMMGYPSELAQIAVDMNFRGVPVRMMCFSPTGEHELENMRMLRDMGVLHSEILFNGQTAPSLDGVQVSRPDRLAAIMSESYEVADVGDFIGSVKYWDTL
jgi:hypothetical protein